MAIITHLKWFSFGNILNNADWGYWPDEAVKELYYSFSSWRGFTNFGFVNIQIYFNLFSSVWSFLANIGSSYDTAVKITFLIPIAIMGFLSPYFFVNKLTKNYFISFISALFYGTVIYFLVRQASHLTVAFVYSIAPLIFYLFIRAIEKNKIKDWTFFILLSFVGICYEVRIMYIVFFILSFYFCFFHLKDIKKYFRVAVLPLAALIFLNLFWFLPTFFGGFNANIQQLANRGLFGSFLFSLEHAFNIYESVWTGGIMIPFIKQPIIIYFWLIPLMAFSVLLFKDIKYKKEIIFFGIISLIGVFLTKQAAEPLTGAYLWLYNNFPGFNLFRESSKFYLITAVGYTGLLAYTLLLLKENKNKILNKYLFIGFSVIILLISFFNTKPLITGEIRTMFIPRHIPRDYVILKDLVLKQPDYFRTFWTPRDSRWGIFINQKPKISNVAVIGSEWENLLENYNENEKLIQNKIINVFKLSFADDLVDLSSIKYVIVPIRDINNDDDFFVSYGGKENPDIRDWYISELDKVEWLKKVDIGTEELVIYENENYKPPIFTTNHLFALSSFKNLENKYEFINNNLNKEFFFTIFDKEKNNKNLLEASSIFEDVTKKNISDKLSLSIFPKPDKNNHLYVNFDEKTIHVLLEKDKIVFSNKEDEKLLFSNQQILEGMVDKKIVNNYKIKPGRKYYLGSGSSFLPLSEGIELQIKVDKEKKLKIYSEKENIISNGSFENGLWQEKVGDCNNRDNDRVLSMSLNSEEKFEGNNSLQLEATKHIACTTNKFEVKGGEYLFSFYYQSPNSEKAGYYLRFNDENKTVVKSSVVIQNTEWNNYTKKITIPKGATYATIHVYAYESDKEKNNIVRYDNFEMRELVFENEIIIPEQEEKFEKIEIDLKEEDNIFEYKNDYYDYKNLIANPSFEDGTWSKKVGDCHSYDDNAILAMSLNGKEKSDGQKSLQLEATRHIACTSAKIPVKSDSVYLLNFDYQGENADWAGYYLGFNDTSGTSISEKLEIKDKNWNSFEKKILVPTGADIMSLYVYAYENDGKNKNIVRYDNFSLAEIPDLENKYYLVSEPKEELKEPQSTEFELINPTKKLVHIKGAETPFFLAMSESYHPQWQLQMNNEKIQGFFEKWWPFAKPERIKDEYHYELNGFLNAWYVDVNELCQEGNAACVKNEDGTYDMELVIEFWPQRWFYFGLIISGTTLVGCLGYLIISWRKRKKEKVKSNEQKV